ncbi:MAG TPA: type I-U CRISPR-associated RAMP protein Csb1/Cas7u [Pyrinomonadaceae bacterium]|nr:type I-U CRISPR-associated RAMP protein Csb1/Cas7u [Pyrinomonadaceae bacterium]
MMSNATLETHDALIRTSDWLTDNEMPVALVLTETLEPALGADAEIFPPTFAKDERVREREGHPYNIDELRHDIAPPAAKGGEIVNICLIDSVGSQANRMETCFKKKPLSGLVPQITVIAKEQKANLLDIGHRIADAAVRFSELEAEAHSAIANLEKNGNALELARLAPTSLVFGFWDSRETQFKFGRILSSVIRATNVSAITRSAQFDAVFDAKQMFEDKEYKEYGTGNNNPLSAQGLQAAPAVGTHGGVRVFGTITRRTQINLVGLRALAATDEQGEINEGETMKLRRYVLGLALVAARCQTSYNLREGCLLARVSEKAEAIYSDGRRTDFKWDLKTVWEYAQAAAQEFDATLQSRQPREVQFEVPKVRAKIESEKPKKGKK